MQLVVPTSIARRILAIVASLAAFFAVVLLPSRALAHDIPALPPDVTSAVVRVDAYEHTSLGAVVGDGRLVLVPFEAIEVARSGWPQAIVTDAHGQRHDAGVAATDRASGLAILVVEHVLTTTPFPMSTSKLADPVDTFAIADYPSSGPLADGIWALHPAGTLAGEGRVPSVGACACGVALRPTDGSPVIDGAGRLLAIMGGGGLLVPRVRELPADALARLDGHARDRRTVIYYGGVNTPFAFMPNGGLWFGLGISFGARLHDVIDLRLDTEFSVLVPAGPTSTATNADCAQKGCTAGIRGVATPSIGYRIVVGGFGGKRAWPIAITPSLGYALGVQRTNRDYGASAADAATPSAWGQLAPGLTLSMWAFEVRGRVRVPIDGTTPPTIELNAGIYF